MVQVAKSVEHQSIHKKPRSGLRLFATLAQDVSYRKRTFPRKFPIFVLPQIPQF